MTALSDAAMKWFAGRGIDPETATNCGVYTRTHERDGDVIVFPFLESGEAVNEKFRGRGKRFWQREGGKKTFWNRDVLLDDALRSDRPQRLVITEGEMDALTAIECGFPFTISVPDGAPAQAGDGAIDPDDDLKFEYVWNNWDSLREVKQIVLAVDSDAPGKALAQELVRRLSVDRCFFVDYPEGCKDLNDVLMKHGKAEVARVLNAAKPYPVKGLYRLSDFPAEPEAKVYSTGWPAVDKHFKIQLGAFIVETGIPGHGKSSWNNALLVNLIRQYGWKVAIGSFEEPPVPYHRDDLRRVYLGADPKTVAPAGLGAADAWIDEHIVFIAQNPADEDQDFDLDQILDLAAIAVVRHGINVLVLDPWNEIEHKRRRDESETEYVGRAIREMKRFAKRYNVCVVVVAHPIKMGNGKDGVSCPTLYDISGSANWFNKADVGIVVWRQDVHDTAVTIKIRKVRRRSIGRVGDVELIFDPQTGQFSESLFNQSDMEAA